MCYVKATVIRELVTSRARAQGEDGSRRHIRHPPFTELILCFLPLALPASNEGTRIPDGCGKWVTRRSKSTGNQESPAMHLRARRGYWEKACNCVPTTTQFIAAWSLKDFRLSEPQFLICKIYENIPHGSGFRVENAHWVPLALPTYSL